MRMGLDRLKPHFERASAAWAQERLGEDEVPLYINAPRYLLLFMGLAAILFGRWEFLPLAVFTIFAAVWRSHLSRYALLIAVIVWMVLLLSVASSPPPVEIMSMLLGEGVGVSISYYALILFASLALLIGLLFLRFRSSWEFIVDFLVILTVYGFLFTIYRPSVMLSNTITTGGDTASHYYPAKYLAEELLPRGRVIGWLPGWYGGMPLFQFYFPLSFVLIALLSYLIPLQIAFKVVTALGVFLLPLCAYYCMRLMDFRFPEPVFAATFTLPFLFQESQSMWGGNIPSTLAGEFSYGISLSLTLFAFGALYRGMREGRYMLHNAVLIAAIALTHVYTVLWLVASSTFIIVCRRVREAAPPTSIRGRLSRMLVGYYRGTSANVVYALKTYPLAFMLAGFWVLPLLARLGYTTSYDTPWNITEELVPPILWPFLVFSAIGIVHSVRSWERRSGWFTYSIAVSLFFFQFASKLGVVDIRFLPFIYLSLMMLAAHGLAQAVRNMRALWVIPLIAVLLTIFWVDSSKTAVTWEGDVLQIHTGELMSQLVEWKYTGYSAYWVTWNYEGFEKKPEWKSYLATNEFMRGGFGDPRAQFEHNEKYNSAGTVRAFESIPLFAGRNILEGLYMQSIITSPFSFYIQSEISEQQSCPFWAAWPCTSFNLENGTEHLKMFNVKHIVARSQKLKDAMRNDTEWALVFSAEPYEVWELTDNPNHYVTVPAYEPVLFETRNWKNLSYQWFKRMDLLSQPIVFKGAADDEDVKRFSNIVKNPSVGSLDGIPRVPLNRNCNIKEVVQAEEIEFSTDCVGLPHIISVSYYPSWQPTGADRVYLVSPSFMLVYPTQNRVKLTYGKTPIDWAGLSLTLAASSIIAFAFLGGNRRVKDFFSLSRGA
jgi:hypothetical protein